MRVTGSRVYSRPPPAPKMPPGLAELMEGLTRDILKNNPPDVYEFCAEHMRKLLEIRDGPPKTLSLDQKILKAQEKVKKRAEQRFRIFQEELVKDKTSTVDSKGEISSDDNKPIIGANVVQPLLKPVHHECDLVQASEIEISCEPDDPIHKPELIQNSNLLKGSEPTLFVEEEILKAHDSNEEEMDKPEEEEIKKSEIEIKISQEEQIREPGEEKINTKEEEIIISKEKKEPEADEMKILEENKTQISEKEIETPGEGGMREPEKEEIRTSEEKEINVSREEEIKKPEKDVIMKPVAGEVNISEVKKIQMSEEGEMKKSGEGEIKNPEVEEVKISVEEEKKVSKVEEINQPVEVEIQKPVEGEVKISDEKETPMSQEGEIKMSGEGHIQNPGKDEIMKPVAGEVNISEVKKIQMSEEGEMKKSGEGEIKNPEVEEVKLSEEKEIKVSEEAEIKMPVKEEIRKPVEGELNITEEKDIQMNEMEELKKPVEDEMKKHAEEEMKMSNEIVKSRVEDINIQEENKINIPEEKAITNSQVEAINKPEEEKINDNDKEEINKSEGEERQSNFVDIVESHEENDKQKSRDCRNEDKSPSEISNDHESDTCKDEKITMVSNSSSLETKVDATIKKDDELPKAEAKTELEHNLSMNADSVVKKNEIMLNPPNLETINHSQTTNHDELKTDQTNEPVEKLSVNTEQVGKHNKTDTASDDRMYEENENKSTENAEIDNDLGKEKSVVYSNNKEDSNGNDSKPTVPEDHDKINKPISDMSLAAKYKNATDLEKVVSDAIENINRKDSSAYESLKDMNVFNEDESDASESSNVFYNNMHVNIDGPRTNTYDINDVVKGSSVENPHNFMNENPEDNDDYKRTKRSIQEHIHTDNKYATQENNQGVAEKCNEPDRDQTRGVAGNVSENFSAGMTQNDNSTAMDLETAAVTIQKVFRTFLFKSRASTFDDSENDDNNLLGEDENKDERTFAATNLNKERRTLGISRMDTVLQTVNEEKSLSLSTDDSSLSSAATIIQAHVRGFLVRNKLNSGKTTSSSSLVNSNGQSGTSIDGDFDPNKSKTILNIHIVPEGGNYLSRDESMITSMDLSLDGSPPSSVNLHPLGYNTSERRKLLKREDAVQSVSPPSNNSGKLSEDVDSVKELVLNENASNTNQDEKITMASLIQDDSHQETEIGSLETTPTNSLTIETVVENRTSNTEMLSSPEPVTDSPEKNKRSLTKQSSDEMDVITPYKENDSSGDNTHKLLHSGEFHDAVLPTKVSRSDTPVVSGE